MKGNPTPVTRQRRAPQGQALLEFALIVTVLLLMVGGIVDVARMYFAYQVASEAAHEGALFGALHADNEAAIRTRVVRSSDVMQAAADNGRIQVTVQTSEGKACADGTNMVVVEVKYTLPLHMPVTMAMFGDEIPISATEQALVLQPACSP